MEGREKRGKGKGRGKVGMRALLIRKGKGEREGIGGRRREGRGEVFVGPNVILLPTRLNVKESVQSA